ncbi:GNAT family N-acetyltransferase [Loigolactobacillus coryniformis]|uniref:GNAT family N-acetyltransferase n=1 Tax=Loigolactobacillus coryniformis TaxID=1610 RepID=A0A5B8TKZ4_9LACO|nr:GNAT family N-acetyltransferase [Loigolactobacillus coryniformis]QEA53149.1 GNAT family N-acetyltransferase [Loigolactobacillus coryniformis]
MQTQAFARVLLPHYELRFLNTVPAKGVYALRHDTTIAAATGRSTDYDLTATMQYISRMLTGTQRGNYLMWGIMDRQTDKFYGLIQLWHFQKQTAEVGYEILSQWQRHGIMQEVLPQVAQLAFEQLDIKRLYAVTGEANLPSRRLLEKVGFQLDSNYHEKLYTFQQTELALVRYQLDAKK